jgi:hypothetical protein
MAYILEEWDKTTIEEINELILSMPDRIDECIERKGDITSY